MNTKIKTIKWLSKILHFCLLITAIVLVMAIAAQTVLMVLAPTLDLANIKFTGMWGSVPVPIDGGVSEFRAASLSEVLRAVIITAILYITSYMFKDISSKDSPFTRKIANRLRVISILIIALSIVVQPLIALLTIIFFPDVNFQIFIRLEYLIFAAVFICLAFIFEYGAELQQQSDETL